LALLVQPGSTHRLMIRGINVLHYSMNFNSFLTVMIAIGYRACDYFYLVF
jgi:hypothetical protein